MKRLLFVLALLCAPAWAGISLGPACTPAAATSCTLASSAKTSPGDLKVSFAYRSSSATAATTAANWTVIKSTTGSVNSLKIAFQFSPGGETTCGTWTNATQTFCQIYRGAWIRGGTIGGAFGDNASGTTATTGVVSYPTFTLINTFSTSWVACAAGSISGTIDSAPTGMTLRSGTSITNIAFSDTNGNVASWATGSGPNPAVKWASACFEIVGSPSTVVSSVSNKVFDAFPGLAAEACTGSCTWTFAVNSSLANNFLIFSWEWQYVTTQPTVSNIYCNSDTGHATWTWTQAGSVDHDLGNTQDGYTYYVTNAAAGCTSVTVVASSVWSNATGHYAEYRAVKTFDQYASSHTGTLDMSPGAITPTASGDLIHFFCSSDTLNTASATGGLAISSGMTPLVTDWGFSTIAASFIYNDTAALTVHAWATALAGNSQCLETAIKMDGTGTAPTGVHVTKFAVADSEIGIATTNIQLPVDSTGDAISIFVNGVLTASATQFGSVSAVNGSYTAHQPADTAGGYPNLALDCNSTAGLDYVTFGTASNSSGFFYYEVAGLDNSSHTACYDSTMGTPVAHGASCVSLACGPDPTATPSTADGIVLAASETGAGPGNGLSSPTGSVYDVPHYTGQGDASRMGTGNWLGHYLNSSTSSETWTWLNDVNTSWQGMAVHLKPVAAAGGNSQPPTQMTMGVGR